MIPALLILDGNAQVWQIATTVPLERAVSAFFRACIDWQLKFPGYRFLLCFDGGRSAFRTQIFPAYKINRRASPQRPQFQRVFGAVLSTIERFSFNHVQVGGVEADDVISILCSIVEKANTQAVIVSDDGDFHQCLTERISVYKPRQERQVEWYEALKEFGGNRSAFLAYKALAGDPSDGIPGIAGIGAIKAMELLHLCGMKPANLFSEQIRRLTKGKMAKAVSHPNFKRDFVTQLRLVRTCRTIAELGELDPLTAAYLKQKLSIALKRLINPLELAERDWLACLRSHDALGFLAEREMFEKTFALKIATEVSRWWD